MTKYFRRLTVFFSSLTSSMSLTTKYVEPRGSEKTTNPKKTMKKKKNWLSLSSYFFPGNLVQRWCAPFGSPGLWRKVCFYCILSSLWKVSYIWLSCSVGGHCITLVSLHIIDQVQIPFLPPILLTVMQCCEQEYHKRQLVRYQPFLERRGDWTYCALAIRSDQHEVNNSNLSCYNIYFFLAGS